MQLVLEISAEDISRLILFMSQQNNVFLDYRRVKNVERKNILLDKDTIIRGIMMCLLTTQQRSGPETPISRFLNLRPFPFTENSLSKDKHLEEFIKDVLASYGLNRFHQNIPRYLKQNINTLQQPGEWNFLQVKLRSLQQNTGKELERTTAGLIQDKFIGLGPKQSRNFLQFLGLTQYEIPLDSRVASWLSGFGFPIPITSAALQDRNYYHFAMDHIQTLCERAGVLPCMLDAAIFSSMDIIPWSIEHIPY